MHQVCGGKRRHQYSHSVPQDEGERTQIKVASPDQVKRLFDRGFDIAVLGTPKLARDKDLVARDARVPDPLADFLLVPVDPGEVEVFVSVLQSGLDSAGDFARAGFPSSCLAGISFQPFAATVVRGSTKLDNAPRPTAGMLSFFAPLLSGMSGTSMYEGIVLDE